MKVNTTRPSIVAWLTMAFTIWLAVSADSVAGSSTADAALTQSTATQERASAQQPKPQEPAQHPAGHEQQPASKPAETAAQPPARPTQVATQPQPPGTPQPPATQQPSQQGQMRGWQLMQDGAAFFTFNRQGGTRGDTEFKSQNWWMTMASRQLGRGMLNLTAMVSLDPATVGKRGYRELFQSGEAANGQPIIDRQHPHDFIGQLSASWRVPLNERTGLTIAGGPIAEPALGPVFFAHRASAAENPTSPLGHHTFDSSHISMGVMTLALDRGPWMIEGSLFNGREPDDDRWDIMDPGALDSWATRLWLRPSDEWEFQLSHGFLKEPEELEHGNLRRTTASVGWMRQSGQDFTAATVALGRNDKAHGAFHGFLAEGTHRFGMNSVYGRLEVQQVESALLLTGRVPETEGFPELRDTVTALTVGGVRDVWRASGFELGIGGDLVFYGVPDRLNRGAGLCGTRTCVLGAGYGSPVSFHIFMRLRPPAPMGRMWNMTLTRPMRHGTPSGGQHGGHQVGNVQTPPPVAQTPEVQAGSPQPAAAARQTEPDHAGHAASPAPATQPAAPSPAGPPVSRTDTTPPGAPPPTQTAPRAEPDQAAHAAAPVSPSKPAAPATEPSAPRAGATSPVPPPATAAAPRAAPDHPGHAASPAPTGKPAAPRTAAPSTRPRTRSADPHAGHTTASPGTRPPANAAARTTAAAAEAAAKGSGAMGTPRAEPLRGGRGPTNKTIDPVCGLKVDPNIAPQVSYQGQTYHFCSEQHRQLFLKDSGKYVPKRKPVTQP